MTCAVIGTFPGLACAAAPTATPAASGEAIATKGTSTGAPPCATCHGTAGEGQAAAGFPRLAGLDAVYLARQLEAFGSGSRSNPVMAPVAKLLSPADRQAVAAYYDSLKVTPTAAGGSAAAASSPADAGRRLAMHGDWPAGLPACAQCHGADGYGVGASFPQIAGQSEPYLVAQLKAWKSGTRKDDPLGLMQGISRRLGDPQIAAVAAYYAGLPVSAPPPSRGKP